MISYSKRVSQIEAFFHPSSVGRLNVFASSSGLVYGFSRATFKFGGKHASVHGFFFLQLLVQLYLSPLQVHFYSGICFCGKKDLFNN